MNTQELANQVKISSTELAEVLKILGIDPALEQLPGSIHGIQLDTYIGSLKSAAIKEKLSVAEIATKVQAMTSQVNQKSSATPNSESTGVGGFSGVNGLEYLQRYFLALTKGQCTVEEAERTPDSLWGVTWLTLKGTSLRAAKQVAAVATSATHALATEIFLRGTAADEAAFPEIQAIHDGIAARAGANLNFFELSLGALPGNPAETLQLSPGAE
jgi:hypothetical protein